MSFYYFQSLSSIIFSSGREKGLSLKASILSIKIIETLSIKPVCPGLQNADMFLIIITPTAWTVSKYRVFSGPYFPAFGLNTERYSVSLRIQSECGKIRTRKNSVFGHFSRSAPYSNLRVLFLKLLYLIRKLCVVSLTYFLKYILHVKRHIKRLPSQTSSWLIL